MTWTPTSLSTANIDSTADNVASGLAEIKLVVDRVNELSAHPSTAMTTAMPLVGNTVVQYASTSLSTYTQSGGGSSGVAGASAANTIPADNTIPQDSEGLTVTSLAFTPKSSTSKLIIEVTGYFYLYATGGTGATVGILTVTKSGSTNAIGTSIVGSITDASSASIENGGLKVVETSGSTSVRTYTVRMGPGSANAAFGVLATNGGTSAVFGGTMALNLTITEIL